MKGMKMGGGMDGMMGMGMMRMRMMGRAPDSTLSRSALPGFPGVSHIYHVGAADFFLDHGEHITLTSDQLVQINKIKEKVLLEQSNYDRKIEQAEQDLWSLTAQDVPDVAKIESTLRTIGELQADQRIAFIRGVGDAAESLTAAQRELLIGQETPPPPAKADSAPATSDHKH